MAAIIFTLFAALVFGFGARDQLLLARISADRGAPVVVLLVAIVCTVLSCAAAAWAASTMIGLLNPKARLLMVAIALGFAAIELMFLRTEPTAKEPTHSLGAFAIVMLARQLSDATRFMVFAMSLATETPAYAALGGIAGSVPVLWLGFFGTDHLPLAVLKGLRPVLGLAVLGLAAFLVVRALGLIGA
jgi:hypothetical protein